MIRDPSDGVREKPEGNLQKMQRTPDSGLRRPTRTDAQDRLERSRERLKRYHAMKNGETNGGHDQ